MNPACAEFRLLLSSQAKSSVERGRVRVDVHRPMDPGVVLPCLTLVVKDLASFVLQ